MKRLLPVFALIGVVICVTCQAFIYWMTNAPLTFGPKGTGAKFLQDLFGDDVMPFHVMRKLQVIIEILVLLILGMLSVVLCGESSAPGKVRHREEIPNPFDRGPWVSR